MGDKVDAPTRTSIEGQIESLKKAMDSNELDAIQREMEKLTQASHKLAEEAYRRASEQQAAGAAGAGGQESAGERKQPEEDVVDADFEEVKGK
jgi:molecular chaperone DnaK